MNLNALKLNKAMEITKKEDVIRQGCDKESNICVVLGRRFFNVFSTLQGTRSEDHKNSFRRNVEKNLL